MSPFPYTFPFPFYIPLIYMRDYKVEVRDARGTLLRFVTRVDSVIITTTLNAPTEMRISIPYDDPATEFLTGQNEVWARDTRQNLIGKFIILERVDTDRNGVAWIEIVALSFLHQLSEEIVRTFSVVEKDIRSIVSDLLDLQQNVNPLSFVSVPDSIISDVRTITISRNINILQVLHLLIKTFSIAISMTVDEDRNLIWTDLDATPGALKRFDVSRNLQHLEQKFRYERAISRLYPYGSARTGRPLRLGDEGGTQRWDYYAMSVTDDTVTLRNSFTDHDNPTTYLTEGDTLVIGTIEYRVLSFVLDPEDAENTIVTLNGEPTLGEPGTIIGRRDYIDSIRYQSILSKEIKFNPSDIQVSGYTDFVLDVSGTYSDMITTTIGASVYFTADDFVTILDAEFTSFENTTGALVAAVKIPRVYGVKSTSIIMFLSPNPPSFVSSGGGGPLTHTILPAVSTVGYREASYTDERIETISMLELSAEVYLNQRQGPVHSYSIRGVDLSRIQNTNQADVYTVGELVHLIDTRLGVDVKTRIVQAIWPLGSPAELVLQFDMLEDVTIDSMFANVIEDFASPDTPLQLTDDAFDPTDIGFPPDSDVDVVHGHDNLDTLDGIPPFSGGTGNNLPRVGVGADWTNISAIYDNDDNMDSAYTSLGTLLKLRDFDMNIPEGVFIRGIVVTVIARDDQGSLDMDVSIMKDDGEGTAEIVGTGKQIAITQTFAQYGLGAENDLWGTTYTVEDINHENFGLAINRDGEGGPLYVDFITIEVFFDAVDDAVLTIYDGVLQWGRQQKVRLAKIAAGPGAAEIQSYTVELYDILGESKTATGDFAFECWVPDDDAPAYGILDWVLVAVPSAIQESLGQHPMIIASAGVGSTTQYPSQFFGIIEGGVKSPFDGT